MSATAFKRDRSECKTILDFAKIGQRAERLRLLLVLTVGDIRAVGPGVWNGWKRQLLTELFDAAEEVLRLGHKQKGRESRIASKKDAVAAQFGFDESVFQALAKRLPESYWIAEPVEVIAANLLHMRQAGAAPPHIAPVADDDRGATVVMVLAADHPALLSPD